MMSPLDSRSFGKIPPDADRSRRGGRPRSANPKQHISLYLTPDLIQAYEREALARWPGSARRRGEVMEEALLSWMLAERLKEGREYEEQSCGRSRRTRRGRNTE